MYLEIILFVLLGLLSSWEEINQLVQRGSWQKDMFYSFLFWETKWNSKWKLFDSHHLAFGLFAFVMCILLVTCTNEFFYWISQFVTDILHITAYWYFFFYIRNLGLHIIFRKNVFRQFKYLLPIQF